MFDKNSQTFTGQPQSFSSQYAASAILKNVYLWMTMALAISGLIAMLVAGNTELVQALYTGRASLFILFLVQFGLIWLISARIGTMSFLTATLLYIAYSVVTGITLSSIFLVFTAESIASVFFITAGTFAAVSIYGFITKKDLSTWRSFLIMGLLGLIIASIVNWFLASEMMYWIISYVGVAVFIGLTAYDTQKIKQLAIACYAENEDTQNKAALLGAITLYLDFINLFLYILRIFGKRK
jgi:FtsH-binding integral membrane protein